MQTTTLLPALTKIVATVGPASDSEIMLRQLVAAGVSVFRLNFSHGTQEQHRVVYHRIRQLSAELGRPVSILQDLQGPKLRIGNLQPGTHSINPGDILRICTQPVEGTAELVSATYERLGQDIDVGDTILIDDGLIQVQVTGIELATPNGDVVVTEVIHGGQLKPQKGINLPGTNLTSPSMTEKDIDDLAFGIELGVDVIALSFVRSAQDVIDAKKRIQEFGGSQPLIAKIEKPQAVTHLEEIVAESNGVMVARGDLGVELSAEGVPLVQKRLIQLANDAGIPVITATQMLESMIENPRPTRAEASDVANAILDGSDAVMLSGETAIGKWPVSAVEVMGRIARTIEADVSWHEAMRARGPRSIPGTRYNEVMAVSHAAQTLATDLGTKAIAVLTATGGTAARISQQRPGVPIVAFTDSEGVASRLSLWHGVVPVLEPLETTTDGLIAQVIRGLKRLGIADTGDRVVIVGAVPRQSDKQSVFLEVHDLS